MSTQTAYSCSFKATSRKLNRVKINDLLEKADVSNESMISSSIPKFRTDLKAPDISPSKEVDTEDEYISVLKMTLESLVVEDEELKNYYDGLSSRLSQKKIDEIYSIISADLPSFKRSKKSLSNSSTRSYTAVGNKHLTKKTSSSKTNRFVQKSFIENDEEFVSETKAVAQYNDDDFDSLSEKIKSGEIGIEKEEVDPSQLTIEMLDNTLVKEKEDDINLKIAFDMISNEDEEEGDDDKESKKEEKESFTDVIFSRLFKYRSSSTEDSAESKDEEESEEYNGFEYESLNDKQEAEKLLKNAFLKGIKKLLASVGVFLLLLLLIFAFGENGWFSSYLDYQKYEIVFIFSQVQLLFLSIAIHHGSFWNGLCTFTTGKFTSESVFAATSIFMTIHSIFSFFNTKYDVQLFNSIPILMSVFMSLNNVLKCKKDIDCFKIISTDEEKFAAVELSATSKEASNFYSYLSEDSEVYTVAKTNLISSFFKRISKRPKSEDILSLIIPGIIFVSAIIFAICFFHGDMGVYPSFTAAVAFFASAMPSASIFVITLPLVSANNACKKFDSAIIGDSAAEEYATASVISFEDRELFPPSKVVMKNMKVYHNMKIDQILTELAKLFSYLGGPLKEFFSNSVYDIFEEHTVIKILKSAENGIMIAADGVDYYLGNGDFMRSNGLAYDDDEDDIAFERQGGSVMIFGANRVVAAKFYFIYKPQKGFKKLLTHMYKCGLCIGIKTLDPNINNNLLSYHADGSQCPISILKSSTPEETTSHQKDADSGIVSKRSLGAFLKAFMLCDKARHSIKSNGIIMISGAVLTALMMIFISITGGISDFSSNHAFLFQILWSITVFVLSFLK